MGDDGLIERQAGLGTVPKNEIIDGVSVSALGLREMQATKHGGLGLIDIGQSQLGFGSSLLLYRA